MEKLEKPTEGKGCQVWGILQGCDLDLNLYLPKRPPHSEPQKVAVAEGKH